MVTLNRIPSTVSNECVEIKATIRSFPQHDRVTWKKNREKIDITLPKYDGSTDIGNSPILCIKNVQKRNDEGIYTIIVHNKLGEGNDKSKLVIIEGMIHVKNKCSTCSSVAIIQCRDYLDLKITFLN